MISNNGQKKAWSSIDLNLDKVFRNYLLDVPLNQRDFVWSEDNTTTFIEDLQQEIVEYKRDKAGYYNYYLGTILLLNKQKTETSIDNFDSRYLVFDGQQRITTLTILFIAIREKAESLKNKLSKSNNPADLET